MKYLISKMKIISERIQSKINKISERIQSKINKNACKTRSRSSHFARCKMLPLNGSVKNSTTPM